MIDKNNGMSDNLMRNITEFLTNANLTSYEINAFLVLAKSSKFDGITAKKISSKSKVPSGRIYEVLDDLHDKGMIEIIDSRPKKFKSLTLNKALENLIHHQTVENKRKEAFLIAQAKLLEADLYNSESSIKKEPIKVFWSTAYGFQSIVSLYRKFSRNSREELLLNSFADEHTVKILPYGKDFFEPFKDALDRGVRLKFIWSFEHDKRSLSDEEKSQDAQIFAKIKKILEETYGLSTENPSFGVRYVHRRIPTLYDIFDRERIIFKLQNPLKPSQIFASMNVLDPDLAMKLRQNFLSLWNLEGLEI
ncbi:MAG: TrmB family transcriptional regulator [Candidatus Hermodarchaeota archaeon]